jgi:predicted transposase YdaD
VSKPYDHVQRFVVATTPGTIARMFLRWEEPLYVETLNVELPAYSNRTVDNLFRVILPDRERPVLLHIEWFTYNDPDLPLRNLRYYLDIKLNCDPDDQHDLVQLVLYAGTRPLTMQSTFTSPTVSYHYNLLDLRDIPYETFLSSGSPEVMLLAILGKMDDTHAAVREILERLAELLADDKAKLSDYMQHVGTLSRLRPDRVEPVQACMETIGIRIHIDRDTDPYYLEGKLEGKLEGLNEGLLKGKLDTAREMFRQGLNIELIERITKLDTATLRQLQAEV